MCSSKMNISKNTRLLLAHFSIMVPHQMDQPQPTKQKRTQNSCAVATIMLIMNEPKRALALSYCEKRGMPTQRQKMPENKVPESERGEKIGVRNVCRNLEI